MPFTNTNGEVVGTYWAWVSDIYSANPWLMGQGNCPTTPHGPEVRRRVECYLKNNAQFPAGMVAKRTIDMNGNNVTTDSYDSTDPSKSTNGLYDFAKRQPNGDIASNDTVTNTVDVLLGNADIYGQVMVSPSGSVTMGPNGSIGPTLVEGDRATTVAQALTNGWLRTDFQVDVPDVILPTGAASWPALPASGPITAGDYKSTLINSSRTVTNGTVRIYLTGNSKSIQLTGNDAITIATGAKLILYTDGSVDIAGNGVVNNTGRPLNCQLYARNTTSVKYSGNAAFNGIIYAPKAAMEIKGGGANGEVSGSIVADTIKMTGGTVFHYDEALRKTGPNSLYNIATWRSLRNTGSGWVSG